MHNPIEKSPFLKFSEGLPLTREEASMLNIEELVRYGVDEVRQDKVDILQFNVWYDEEPMVHAAMRRHPDVVYFVDTGRSAVTYGGPWSATKLGELKAAYSDASPGVEAAAAS